MCGPNLGIVGKTKKLKMWLKVELTDLTGKFDLSKNRVFVHGLHRPYSLSYDTQFSRSWH
jgi:hypothetical protein